MHPLDAELQAFLAAARRWDGRPKPAPLAAECDQLVVAAVTAAQAQEAVGQDAARQEGVELVFDKLRQVGAGCVFGLLEVGRGVLLNQAVQLGLFRAVAPASEQGCQPAPAGATGEWANGLHAGLPKW